MFENMVLITEKDVYNVKCKRIPAEEYDGERFIVTLGDEVNQVVRKIEVRLSGTLLASTGMQEPDKFDFASRAACRLVRSNEKGNEVSITTGNFDLLRGKQASDEEIDDTLRLLIHRFFTKYPDPKVNRLSPADVFLSTDFDFQRILNRLGYFEARGIIRKSSLNEYEYDLALGGFEKLEALERSPKVGPEPENRYFQLVPLSKKVKEPFVFALMPFKPREFGQKVYSDVIKPTVEKELGICCIRSDEETKLGVINNQIFTMIRKAKLIIAETTSRNPNVFYEVGMAHAFNKDVFIFNSSKKNKKLPFDIITNRAVFYDGYEDLKKKIVENLKDHVS